jgi:hypothetical protein
VPPVDGSGDRREKGWRLALGWLWPRGLARAAGALLLAGSLTVLAGCGASAATATPAGSPPATHAGSGPRRFRPNPALRAASEIVLVAPVVPFSARQVHELVPLLQALAKDPNLPAAQLAARAKALTAVLTAQQLQALHNMEKAHYTGSSGFPAGGSGFRFRGAPAAKGKTAAARRRFNPSAIYQRAIAVLEGKVSGGFGAFGATAGSASAPAGGTA